jgi:hypothetical protein
MLRNHAADGTYLGPRAPSPDGPVDVARQVVKTSGEWLLPIDRLPLTARGALAVGLAAVVVVVAVRAARGRRDRLVSRASFGRDPSSALLVTLAATVVVGLGYVAYAQLTTAIDPIDSRLLSPLFVPLLVLAVGAADSLAPSVGPVVRRAVLAAGVVVLAAHAWGSGVLVRDGMRDGYGFATASWVDSPLADALARRPDLASSTVYANSAPGLWAATRLPSIENTPWRTWYRGPLMTGSLERFGRQVACSQGPSYVVWYRRAEGGTLLHSLDDLRTVVTLDEVASTTDGSLFLARTTGTSACSNA